MTPAWLAVAITLAACAPKMHEREDEYAAVRKAATGPCVSSSGKGNFLLFCVDGRALIICGDDSGCMTVRLDTEAKP